MRRAVKHGVTSSSSFWRMASDLMASGTMNGVAAEPGLNQPLLHATSPGSTTEDPSGQRQPVMSHDLVIQPLHGSESKGLDDDPKPLPTQPELGPQNLAAQGESLATEANRVLWLAAPIVVGELLSFFSYLVTTAQAGSLGASALSAFTLARTVFHITGLSIVVGLGSACDTFSGQAYGSGKYGLVGVYMQRSCAINLLVAAGVVCGWWPGASQLMLALGQDPTVVEEAVRLLMTMGPSLLVWAALYPTHSYFSAQAMMKPLALLSAIGVFTTPLTNCVLVNIMGLGITGIALGYNVLAVLELLGMAACMVWLHYQQPSHAKTWSGWHLRAALSEWPAYLKIALPSMAMICLDWWCFEVVILVAGLQPHADVQLGAMGVMFATHSLSFMIISGFGTAAATRVANELGAGHGAAARRATTVCAGVGFLAAMPIAVALYLAREPWARVFTQDEEVIEAISSSMLFLTLGIVADSINAVLSGVLRGSGHQAVGFAINLVTLWLMGIPAAYTLDIVYGMGARGVWMALSTCGALQAVVLLLSVGSWNWDKQAQRAEELLATGHGITTEEVTAAAGGPGGHHGVYEPLLAAQHA